VVEGAAAEGGRRVSSSEEQVDRLVAGEHWAFDRSVTAVFDNMLQRSIPQYGAMRDAVAGLAMQFAAAVERPLIVDLGCSRGEAIAGLVEALPAARFVGVEASPAMLKVARERFGEEPRVEVRELDLRTGYPSGSAQVTLAVLTVQFVPIEYRQQLLHRVFENTAAGGVLIMVEKVLGSTAELDRLMVDSHLELKRRNGYSQEEIDRKRLSLEGVLVPVTANWNVEMLESAGFAEIDCFWRWMNFAGWIAVRR